MSLDRTLRPTRTITVVGAGVAASLIVGMAAASAATPFLVKAGNALPYTRLYLTAKSKGAITLREVDTGGSAACTSATAPGSTWTGPHHTMRIGRLSGTKSMFRGCSATGGGPSLNVVGVGRWGINATGYRNGVAAGYLSDVHVKVSVSVPPPPQVGCSFDAAGSVPLRYVDKVHTLSLLSSKARLVASNVTAGCDGGVNNGDKLSMQATLVVTANRKSFNPITIRR